MPTRHMAEAPGQSAGQVNQGKVVVAGFEQNYEKDEAAEFEDKLATLVEKIVPIRNF